MQHPEPVLICALSGRALAQSARAAGFAPIVLDAFGDLDTREAAMAWARVPVDRRWRFRRADLLASATRLAPPPIPLVWGSGFEGCGELLAELAAGRPCWGMAPSAVRVLKDPIGLARLTASLGVAHPETRLRPPLEPDGWLIKRRGAAGGGHVHPASGQAPHGRGWYWQRWAPGRPVSALVQGDGRRACVLGFSEQWAAPGHHRPFRFGGAAAPADLSPRARARLARDARALAERCGLSGITSIDALVDGESVTVLEINPRPGASLDAYERAYGVNLFRLHHDGCGGRLAAALSPVAAAGSAIVYAPVPLSVPDGSPWPAWAADRSPPGTMIPVGGPVCTVLATAASVVAVRAELDRRRRLLMGLMTPASMLKRAACRRSSVAPPSPDAERAIGRRGAAPP